MLFIAREVSSASVFNLIKFLVIYFLKVVSVGLSLSSLIVYEITQLLHLNWHQLTKSIIHMLDLSIHPISTSSYFPFKEVKLFLPSLIFLVDVTFCQLIHLLYFFLQLLLISPRPVIKHWDLVLTLIEQPFLLFNQLPVLWKAFIIGIYFISEIFKRVIVASLHLWLLKFHTVDLIIHANIQFLVVFLQHCVYLIKP